MREFERQEDLELLRQIKRGDQKAFLEFYDRYAPRVYGLAVKILGETMAAEEVTQDIFMKIWDHAASYSPEKGKLISWLLTITHNAAVDRVRFEERRPDFGNPADPENLWLYTPTPESTTEEARWRSIHFALQDLPEEQREVIELAYYHRLSQSQISEHTGAPLGTVKTRVRLGMEKLRNIWLEERSKTRG